MTRRSGGWASGSSALLAMALLLVAPASPLAHERTRLDPDDSRGPLDVVAVRLRHRVVREVTTHPEASRRTTELRFRLVTYEKWKRSTLEGSRGFVAFELDLDGDKRIERCLLVRNGREELIGRLYRGCYRRMRLVTSASVSRPDRHSLRTSIDKRRLRTSLDEFRWRATTSAAARGDGCTRKNVRHSPYGRCRDSTRWQTHRFRRSR